MWLSLTQEKRYLVMYWFRHLLLRECFQRFLRTRKNQRRLFKLAKAKAESDTTEYAIEDF